MAVLVVLQSVWWGLLCGDCAWCYYERIMFELWVNNTSSTYFLVANSYGCDDK